MVLQIFLLKGMQLTNGTLALLRNIMEFTYASAKNERKEMKEE